MTVGQDIQSQFIILVSDFGSALKESDQADIRLKASRTNLNASSFPLLFQKL